MSSLELPTFRKPKGLPTKNLKPSSWPAFSFDSALCKRVSSGLGSNVSICPGPPSMKSMMTALACGKCIGCLGESGLDEILDSAANN